MLEKKESFSLTYHTLDKSPKKTKKCFEAHITALTFREMKETYFYFNLQILHGYMNSESNGLIHPL